MDRRFDPHRPSAGPVFYKAHGLGNDYLVAEEGGAWPLEPGAVERVCHRTLGVGSDGIVVLLGPADAEPFRLRMFNPDGSEFERSGNGLRVLASYLHRTGRITTGRPFEVEVGGDRIGMTVNGAERGRYDVSVEMGRARTGPEAVQADRGMLMPERVGGTGTDGALEVPTGLRVPVVLVSVGNPHCVVFTDDLSGSWTAAPADGSFSRSALEVLGPPLTAHPAFADGANVQLARVIEGGGAGQSRDVDGGSAPQSQDVEGGSAPESRDGRSGPPEDAGGGGIVDALVWERGVGHTSASGTSACAVAVAAVRSGRLPPGRVEVRMEGGTLDVEVSAGLDVVLRGPVEEVMTGELTPGFAHGLGRIGASPSSRSL